jgi:hypothetical protein
MPTPEQVTSQMRQTLQLTEPDLDTGVGTPIRKILDAVGEAIAEASVDNYLLQYQYDVDSRVGGDLDDFVRLFGFTRLPARRATGILTFERSSPSPQPFLIPATTQVATETNPSTVMVTVTPGVLGEGDTSVSVPAQALIAGIGGNLPADTVRRALTNVQGVTTITNPVAFEGGADAESDESLRQRFKRTLFRSLAGTESMYLGTALEDPNVTQANVIGSVKRFIEQIELVTGNAVSTITDAKYIYPDSSTFGPDIAAGEIRAEAIHYDFNATVNPPEIDSLSPTIVPDGVYDLEYDYLPNASRNDPAENITNRVDIWAKGSRPTEAIETIIFDTARLFNNTSSDPLYRQNFQRVLTEAVPTNGNFFVPFGFAPVLDPASVDNEIEIDGVTYIEGTHFWLVEDKTAFGRSNKSASGIEFLSTANGLAIAQPPDSEEFQVTYLFNSVPRDIDNAIQRWRLVTQDVWVHQAKEIRLNLYFAVILQPGFDTASVKPEMLIALANFIDRIGFNGVVQTSDLLAVAHSTAGVDAIRFETSTDDAVNYAIQRVNGAGTLMETFHSGGRAIDVFATDDSVPVLNDIFLTAKAQNTFGTA